MQHTKDIWSRIKLLYRKAEPYYDIILFVLCLLGANFFWKYTVLGEDSANAMVTWFGLDITAPFDVMAEHIAYLCAKLSAFVRPTAHYMAPYTVLFDPNDGAPHGFAVSIIWGCTAFKQSFIWMVIMSFARGRKARKLWFIPLGWLCIYLFNILRITLIALLCEHHPAMFTFWHEYFFKYLFYGMLFMLWVWWVERLGKTAR